MDRATRKANFKKLQLPTTSTRSRTNRTGKMTSAISNYFNIPRGKTEPVGELVISTPSPTVQPFKLQSGATSPCKRLQLNTFLFKDGENNDPTELLLSKKPRESNVFEKVENRVKKAPKLKSTTSAKKTLCKARPKGQPNIKSAFLRNEQLFSEITAQHCLADNLNPDDIELALAISKSEAEKKGLCVAEDVVNLNERESIRQKLQQFGFRTTSKEDYNVFSMAFLPGAYRGRKNKWANKFTALTLRNPELQEKKLKTKIQSLKALRYKSKTLADDESCLVPYKLTSKSLKNLKAELENRIIIDDVERQTKDLEKYYVANLFEVRVLPAGYLLKNWAGIQGRDLSPGRRNPQNEVDSERLNKIYAELEMYYTEISNRTKFSTDNKCNIKKYAKCDIAKTEQNIKERNEDLDKLLDLLDEDKTNCDSINEFNILSSPISEPPDKRAKMLTESDLTATPNTPSFGLFSLSSQTTQSDSSSNNNLISKCERAHTKMNLNCTPSSPTSSGLFSQGVITNGFYPDNIKESMLGTETEILSNLFSHQIKSACPTVVNTKISNSQTDTLLKLESKYNEDSTSNCVKILSEHNRSNKSWLTISSDSFALTQTTRSISPDIFADSDVEDSADKILVNSVDNGSVQRFLPCTSNNNSNNEESHHITTYELYSSDEVKTTSCIDLTDSPKSAVQLQSLNDTDLPYALEISNFDKTFSEADLKNNLATLNTSDTIDLTQLDSEETEAKKSSPQKDSSAILWDCNPVQRIDFFNLSPDIAKGEKKNEIHFTLKQNKHSIDGKPLIATKREISCEENDRVLNELYERYVLQKPDNRNHQGKYKNKLMTRKSVSFTESEHNSSKTLKCNLKLPRSITSNNLSTNKSKTGARTALVSPATEYVDLTQSISDVDSDNDELMLLSDDEINYSMWKSNKTINTKAAVKQHEFSFLDILDEVSKASENSSAERHILPRTLSKLSFSDDDTDEEAKNFLISSGSLTQNEESNPHSSNKSALSRERAEFGIMNAALSEPFSTQLEAAPREEIGWAHDSFLDEEMTTATTAMKHYNSSQKFAKLLSSLNDDLLTDYDEFDELVLGAKKDMALPSGLDQLLTGDINFCLSEESSPKKIKDANTPTKSKLPIANNTCEPIKSPITSVPSSLDQLLSSELNYRIPDQISPKKIKNTKTPIKSKSKSSIEDNISMPQHININGNVYDVRICTSPKPDFEHMSEPELLKRLYNYGIKPLSRKKAIIMLEHIYNQMHPIILSAEEAPKPDVNTNSNRSLIKSKSAPTFTNTEASQVNHPLTQLKSAVFDDGKVSTQEPKFQLQADANGPQLLRYSNIMHAELPDEIYILQTNVTKKTPQPLLPLHIAWYNLVCANPALHESVLMYEPIDLQEIYLHLKNLGYRYDPKDLKCFFDRRCIIFRYELGAQAFKQTERHVRKIKKRRF